MAITNGYITAARFKNRMGITDTATTDDATIDEVINSVSRWIDNFCGRRFYGASEARKYTPINSRKIYIFDLLSVVTFGTDSDGDRTYEDTWAVTDYDLMPANALLDGRPFTWVQVAEQSDFSLPAGITNALQITGMFGYNTFATGAPSVVVEACYEQSSRIFKRKDAPFGIAGVSELGTIQLIERLDPDVKQNLTPVIKYV